jgi:glycosyltransferase involved in cell wall biosynthesis
MFTYGASLKTWEESGLLQREIQLYQKLIEQYGVEVNFFTYGDANDRKWESDLKSIKLFPVYERLPNLKFKVFSLVQTVLIPWYFRKEFQQTDIIKTNQIWGGWIAVLVKWIFQKPLLVRCGYEAYKNSISGGNNGIKHIVLKYVSWFSYKNADHIFLTTDKISEFVKDNFFISDSKITVHPNWIDTNLFRSYDTTSRLTERVLFVGRLSEEKNITLLLNALYSTNIGLDIVGSGKMKDEIEQLSIDLSVDVRFLGRVPNNLMPELYNNYTVYVLCSKYEGNPKSLLEAMSCGCAVIGTNVTGIKDIIQHNKTGLLVENDVKQLSDSINMLISDDALCKSLSKSAQHQIHRSNSISNFLKLEYKVYERLYK